MKATGVVVEYNPFHNGHLHHVMEARKQTHADVIIAVMSGNFLQRGEPAFVDKWTRAKMALENQVDIVFELPYAFATAHAPEFARGAITILDAAQCDAYCFGSEDGNIEPFERALDLIQQAGQDYEQTVKDTVQQGVSYPRALNEAYRKTVRAFAPDEPIVDLTKPNNILGFQYMEAARKLGSSMNAVTIPRIVAGYYDDAIEGNPIASATGIRKSFFEMEALDAVSGFIPEPTRNGLSEWQTNHQAFGAWSSFYPLLRVIILREGPERLSQIADITEGIENLLYRAAVAHGEFEPFMNEVKSKRYTWTRIQRMLTHIFTGFTYGRRKEIQTPTYLRLLGMTQEGQLYLNRHKKKMKLPIVSKVASFSDPSLALDCKASDMYALGIGGGTDHSELGMDFKRHPIIIQ
ncbi:nucleotidyltransferase [Sporosarcina sp. 179-K 3D1 HS]|uniref:nucleotidyltransferase n=1 Tax=Sporosarcina sp. 179-K 3D1 HS TaxID=3232169 RepID=UPI0039A3C101